MTATDGRAFYKRSHLDPLCRIPDFSLDSATGGAHTQADRDASAKRPGLFPTPWFFRQAPGVPVATLSETGRTDGG